MIILWYTRDITGGEERKDAQSSARKIVFLRSGRLYRFSSSFYPLLPTFCGKDIVPRNVTALPFATRAIKATDVLNIVRFGLGPLYNLWSHTPRRLRRFWGYLSIFGSVVLFQGLKMMPRKNSHNTAGYQSVRCRMCRASRRARQRPHQRRCELIRRELTGYNLF